MTRECRFCGKHFTPNQSDTYDGLTVCCSVVCSNKNRVKPKERLDRVCEVCGKSFIADGQRSPKFNRFCSRACGGKGRRHHKDHPCPVCGKIFRARARGRGMKTNLCCSVVCRGKHYRMEKNKNWKGGRFISKTVGYVQIYIPRHPAAGTFGYVSEHRLVMDKKIGRYLFPFESVHHRNGIKTDNHQDNLELWTKPGHGSGQRVIDLAEWVVKNYRNEVEMWLGITRPTETPAPRPAVATERSS